MTPHTQAGTSGRTPNLRLPQQSPHLDIPQAAQGQQEPLNDANDPGPSYLVISGGTGCNAICAAFAQSACYVLPVSDDGGSSSEIIRVLGGPSIGKLSFLASFPHRSSVPYHRGRHHQFQPHH